MSEVKKLRPVSKAELAAKGVSALSDRPNTRKQYGVGGLTAQELKAWFDKLSVFLAEKINEIHDTISEDGASDYIKIDTDDADIATLGDLVRSIYSGYLSERALNVSVPGLTSGTLRYVLTRLKQDISLNAENINTLMESAGVRISSVTSDNTATVRLTNSTGKVLAFITLDLTATTDRIADGAVTMPKIAVKSLSTDAFADQSVSTRTIQPKAVTEDKLSAEFLLKLASLAGGALSGVSFDPATNRITVTNAAGQSFSAELVFDSSSIDADPKGTAKQAVSTHNADTSAHADLRKIVSELAQRLSAIADSDDGTLDQLSEIVAYIKNNKNLIENITTSKVSYADIVSDLVTGGEQKALSAAQGVKIKALIDGLDRDKASHAELASELERLLREAKDSGEFDGESISIVSTQESSGSGGINVVTFSDGSKLNVKNGYTPYIGENGNWYIGNVDTTIKAKGEAGKSITVSSVTESTESGGNNVVAFSDGSKLNVKNGKDYVLTEADKEGIAVMAAALIKENGVIGYVDENNNIVLSGNLADQTYTVKYEMADGSTVDIGELKFAYSVTNALTNCVNSNSATSVVGGGSYSASISANDGYELKSVTVTMGGANVSVTNGVINIANVTGNIVITAIAEEVVDDGNMVRKSVDTSGNPFNGGLGYKNGYYASSTGFKESEGSAYVVTGLMPNVLKTTSDVLYIKGATLTTSDNKCRFITFTDAYAVHGLISGDLWSSRIAVETLGTNYYKLTPLSGYVSAGNGDCPYFRISLIGTGEELIISAEPIE